MVVTFKKINDDDLANACKAVDPTLTTSTPNFLHILIYGICVAWYNAMYKIPKQFRRIDLSFLKRQCLHSAETGPKHVRALIRSEEENYIGKWEHPRNWFSPAAFKDLHGKLPDVCDSKILYEFDLELLVQFGLKWLKATVGPPNRYYSEVSCPNNQAHSGIIKVPDSVCLSAHLKDTNGHHGNVFASSKIGLYWPLVEEVAAIKRKHECLLNIPPIHAMTYRLDELDTLYGYGVGFLRKDGGPHKPRLVVNSPKDAYYNEFPFLRMCYTDQYKYSYWSMVHLFNVRLAAASLLYERAHSGDWSQWDLRNRFRIMQAACIALGIHLGMGNDPNFRAACYRAMWMPVWYSGEVHYWQGRSRSGSGMFVIINNICNAIVLQLIEHINGRPNRYLPTTYGDDFIRWLTQYRPEDEDEFVKVADMLGYKAKLSAQHYNRDAVVACRTILARSTGFKARPILASVVRNLLWPGYEPHDPEQRNIYLMAMRLRDVRKVLRCHPRGEIVWKYLDQMMVDNLWGEWEEGKLLTPGDGPSPTFPDLAEDEVASLAGAYLDEYRLSTRLESANMEV